MIQWPEVPHCRCGRRMVLNSPTADVYQCSRQRGHIYWVHSEPVPHGQELKPE
jgi:hypothetical protein